jgi:hypothetical protein
MAFPILKRNGQSGEIHKTTSRTIAANTNQAHQLSSRSASSSNALRSPSLAFLTFFARRNTAKGPSLLWAVLAGLVMGLIFNILNLWFA